MRTISPVPGSRLAIGKLGSARMAALGSVLSSIAGQVALLISGVIAARLLGVENRGFLALLVLFPVIIAYLGSIGLPQAVAFYVSGDRERAGGVVRLIQWPVFVQLVILTLLHAVVIIGFLNPRYNTLHTANFLTLGAVPGLLAHQYGLSLLQGCGRFFVFNLVRLLSPGLYALVLVLLLLTGSDSIAAVAAAWSGTVLISGIVTLTIGCFVTPPANPLSSTEIPSLKELTSFGLKGLLGSTSPMEAFRLDHLAAGFLLSPSALGLYVIAQAFTSLPRLIAHSVSLIVYPTIATHNDNGKSWDMIWRSLWGVSAVNLLLTAALMAVVPFLIPLLFGGSFAIATPAAMILLIGAFFTASRRIFVEGLRGLGHPEVSTYAELSIYPFFVAIGFILISRYELIGLAVTMVLAYMLSLIVAIALGYRYRTPAPQVAESCV